jgi:molybdenum-dependent DNA-binding transcriptional regulator ModE
MPYTLALVRFHVDLAPGCSLGPGKIDRRCGGVELTAFGREVVRRYRDAYARIESVARAA